MESRINCFVYILLLFTNMFAYCVKDVIFRGFSCCFICVDERAWFYSGTWFEFF